MVRTHDNVSRKHEVWLGLTAKQPARAEQQSRHASYYRRHIIIIMVHLEREI
jgi:hypothetical protein